MSVARSIAVACMAALLAIAFLTISPGNRLPTVLAGGELPTAVDAPDLAPPCAIQVTGEAADPKATPTFFEGSPLQPRTTAAEVFRPPQAAL